MVIPWRRLLRPRELLIIMTVFYTVVSGVVGAMVVLTDLRESRQALETRTREVAQLLDEHANRTLDATELVVQRVADRVALQGVKAATTTMADRAAIAGMIEAVPYISNLYLVGVDGRILLDAKGFHPVGTAFAEREWVRTALADAQAGTVIGRVAFDDASRAFTFPLVRRVSDSSGAFQGLVAAQVDVDYFKRFYQRLTLGPAQAMGIYGLDGTVLVRQPLKRDDVGRNFGGTGLYLALEKSPEGSIRGNSPYDMLERVLSYRLLPTRKLVVWVAVADDAVVEAWRLRALRTFGLALAGLVVMAGLAALLVRELSRERQASSALVDLNRELERSNADLEQFAYVASHDLKEPLRNIASYVQLLQRRYQGRLDPDADAFIGYTVDGVRRLQSIINELLAYSRIGTGHLTLAPVQAGVLVSTALAHLKGVIAEAQAAVEVKGPMPVVVADAAQLGSLFQNLIANALKYRRDDVRPEVAIGCEDGGATWDFYVRDNGIGIDQQYHRQIFDLFKRLHTRDRYTGTGIGLAICQRVVERHGGRIWVESKAGQGSTFRFSLPKRAEE
ncbi:MAG: ATP-binding protein [Magnetospirillum sp.]|nr:ATP-binding protein [Magnetospirillum sp.]